MARRRARLKGLAFAITEHDIPIPERCPVLDIPLILATKKLNDNSPTLDRIVPALGYVVGNCLVVSNLANKIKTTATPEQVQRVASFYTRLTSEKENDG